MNVDIEPLVSECFLDNDARPHMTRDIRYLNELSESWASSFW